MSRRGTTALSGHVVHGRTYLRYLYLFWTRAKSNKFKALCRNVHGSNLISLIAKHLRRKHDWYSFVQSWTGRFDVLLYDVSHAFLCLLRILRPTSVLMLLRLHNNLLSCLISAYWISCNSKASWLASAHKHI